MSGQEILTFKETKQYLKVSSSTLYRLVQGKKIPASKIGHIWRFKKDRVDKWLEKQENVRK